tara:strand:+ start:601 stop:966 length:366 start_codon:yes stop_codon:yes gene_type:complete
MIFSILNNPLTKLAVGKVTDHFKHKAEKVKTIRAAEIEAAKDVDITRIKSQDKSWKDEILMVWLIAMLSTGWFESTRDNFEEWVRIINDLPDSVWYLVIIVFTATFSTKMTDKVLNRNKKK